MHENIVILDFGSQYTQLIARRVRETGVYSEIHPCTVDTAEIDALEPRGVILSGGPCSVYDEEGPQLDPALSTSNAPMAPRCPSWAFATGSRRWLIS